MYKEKGREINSAEEEQILQSEEDCGSTYEDEWMTLSPPKPGVKRRICTRQAMNHSEIREFRRIKGRAKNHNNTAQRLQALH